MRYDPANTLESHLEHFECIDAELEVFTLKHGFQIEKNFRNNPCRILRKGSNPKYVIEIMQEGDWMKVFHRDDLPHTVVVAGYFVDEKQEFVYQMNEEVAYFLHFPTLQANLNDYLISALGYIEKWTADVIFKEGSRSEHPMAYYRKQGGIKIETVD